MAPRRKLIAGNWKMNLDRDGARKLAREVAAGLRAGFGADVLICPPFPWLADAVEAVRGAAHPIAVGAQNMHFEKQGAFTGEVSAAMVLSSGARWVILGHSERRHVFGEGDALVGRKVRAALEAGLHPILCVGEKLDERERGDTAKVVLRQLDAGLEGLGAAEIGRVVIAYEPVWAIGTGRNATPEQGEEVHRAIRERLAALASPQAAAGLRILYGGSVTPANSRDLLARAEIDGALVGGASLEAAKFLGICGSATGG